MASALKYINEMNNLYQKVGDKSFYSSETANVFPTLKIQLLSQRGFIEPTGEVQYSKWKHKLKQWRFTNKGREYLKRYF